MQYAVTGTKNPSDKTRSKFFACKTDAERFASECGWSDVRVHKMTPVVPRKETDQRLKSRGLNSAARYLQNQGYEIIDREYSCDAGTMDIIANDDGALVFIEISIREVLDRGFPDLFDTQAADVERDSFERIAMRYMGEHLAYCDVPVRFDVVDIMVVGTGRALLRHRINALAEGF